MPTEEGYPQIGDGCCSKLGNHVLFPYSQSFHFACRLYNNVSKTLVTQFYRGTEFANILVRIVLGNRLCLLYLWPISKPLLCQGQRMIIWSPDLRVSKKASIHIQITWLLERKFSY